MLSSYWRIILGNKVGRSHIFIPDCQTKPGVRIDHLDWVGKYISERRPNVLVCAGDFWDMPSLSSYDKGKRGFEGRRYQNDVEFGNEAMERLLHPIRKMGKHKPRLVFTMGNHEERIERATEAQPELHGAIGYKDLNLRDWEVHNYLEVVRIDGVAYSHFFPRAASGKVMQNRNGAPNAKAQLVREGGSCTAGHCQGFDIACVPLRGSLQWGIIAGSCYQHEEGYLGPQGTAYWRGLVVKHDVRGGAYCPMLVDLKYLKQRYGK